MWVDDDNNNNCVIILDPALLLFGVSGRGRIGSIPGITCNCDRIGPATVALRGGLKHSIELLVTFPNQSSVIVI